MTLEQINARTNGLRHAAEAELEGKPLEFQAAAKWVTARAAETLSKKVEGAHLLWHWNGQGLEYTVLNVPLERAQEIKQVLAGPNENNPHHQVRIITTESLRAPAGHDVIVKLITTLARAHSTTPEANQARTFYLEKLAQHIQGRDDQSIKKITANLPLPPREWHGRPSQRPR
ncbi:hypothetical protein AUJ14_03995 [Candidatus Micrarchaeota archaeon CG1_02_55_22]|nr:MAG: hypothetical protein AUJ14_03995 [Candidatus Micrarchaeota archaeon CG1_02_55_22]